MATAGREKKLVVIKRMNHKESSRSNQWRDKSFPTIEGVSITQVSTDIEKMIAKKLFQEFSGTKSRNLDALSKLDDFLLNLKVRLHSGPVPETSRNSRGKNKETNEERSQNGPYPEVGVSMSQSSPNVDPDEIL